MFFSAGNPSIVVHDSLDLLPFVHGIVGLCFSRSAPAFADVLLQQVFQLADYFGMFLIDIFAFGGIVFHIIELNRWELGNGFLVHTRFGVAPTAGTVSSILYGWQTLHGWSGARWLHGWLACGADFG